MNTIIEKVREEVLKSNKYFIENYENYDFWNEHIKVVVECALKLAKLYDADLEIVELGALLHDIALIKKIGDRKEHAKNGAKISQDMLVGFGYDVNKTKIVVNCVLHHSSTKNAKSIEEICVGDADIMAHFYNIPMIIQYIFGLKQMNLVEGSIALKKYYKKDFEELSEKTKEFFSPEYNNIMTLLENCGF